MRRPGARGCGRRRRRRQRARVSSQHPARLPASPPGLAAGLSRSCWSPCPSCGIVSALRGRQDVHVPLVTTAESYAAAAGLVAETLRRHGIDVMALTSRRGGARCPRASSRAWAASAFSGLLAAESAYFRGRRARARRSTRTRCCCGARVEAPRAPTCWWSRPSAGGPTCSRPSPRRRRTSSVRSSGCGRRSGASPEAHVEAWALRSRGSTPSRPRWREQPLAVRRVAGRLPPGTAARPGAARRAAAARGDVYSERTTSWHLRWPAPVTTAPADNPRALSTVALMRRIADAGSAPDP